MVYARSTRLQIGCRAEIHSKLVLRSWNNSGAPVLRKNSTSGAPNCCVVSYENRSMIGGAPIIYHDRITLNHNSGLMRKCIAHWCSDRGIFPEHRCSDHDIAPNDLRLQIGCCAKIQSNLVLRSWNISGAPVLRKNSTSGAPICFVFPHNIQFVIESPSGRYHDRAQILTTPPL
jgi:hypothetical protein